MLTKKITSLLTCLCLLGLLASRAYSHAGHRIEGAILQENDVILSPKAQKAIGLRVSPVDLREIRRELWCEASVMANQLLFAGADLSKLWVKGRIFTHDIAQIRLEQEVEFCFGKDFGETLSGKIGHIDARLDSWGMLGIWCQMERGEPLQPGESGRMAIILGHKKAIAAPAQSFVFDGLNTFAFVQLGTKKSGWRIFERKILTIGWRQGDYVEIIDGLFPGDEVVTTGQCQLATMFMSELLDHSILLSTAVKNNLHIELGEITEQALDDGIFIDARAVDTTLQEDTATVWWQGYLDESEAARISAKKVDIRVHASSLPGRVFIGKQLLFSEESSYGRVRIKVAVNDPDGMIRLQMAGKIFIAEEKMLATLTVPNEAILRENGNCDLFIIQDSEKMILAKVPVVVGKSDDRFTAIQEGEVKVGQQVVVMGVEAIQAALLHLR